MQSLSVLRNVIDVSMVGQPLYPGMEEEEEDVSEASDTLDDSQHHLTPGAVLQEVVDYFHEGDKMLDKKRSKK